MSDDHKLHQVLRDWQVELSPDPQFNAEVWRSIAAEEARGWSGFWARLGDWLFVQLPRPAYASALLCAAAVIGLTTASLQASRMREHYREANIHRYLQSIDPIAMAENPSVSQQ
ncbi:MAG: hypothetical protein KGJ37_03660 [Verrucomicrobiota bacterium]|nr:hypothetical protein [Verrucomicrobiota bacterium]